MLDIKLIRQNPNLVKEGIIKKNVEVDIDKILKLDKKKRILLQEVENLRHQQKGLGKEKIAQARQIKEKIRQTEAELAVTDQELQRLLYLIPNLPQDDVPVGKDESKNVVLREIGKKPKFDFRPKDYLEIAQNLDWIDIERAAKVSGSRFGYIKSQAALLEFALIQFAFSQLVNQKFLEKIIRGSRLAVSGKPFIPVIPPVMLKPEMMKAMGYLERGAEEIYHLEKDDLYLVGTSEQSIGAMHQNEIFKEDDLPRRYIGFSTCFRREAGSYGKDTKGILRVHQFDKVEMFSFCRPEQSRAEHQLFLGIEEALMQKLKIPYRVMQICTGDLGDPAAAKYDIEAWIPSEGKYRETHSTSNCTEFQARRLNIRYRPKIQNPESKIQFVHTLNGTVFAIGRMLIAIIENYQQKNGSVKMPKVLGKYLVS